MMKAEKHVFQGMSRDVSPLQQKAEFLWDALNIRLTSRDGDSLFSITNEKGNVKTDVTLEGIYVGHCIVGEYLVVFTATYDGCSYIYRLKKLDNGFEKITLYSDDGGLYFDINYPIETLASYESELVQKVYWVDGIHQPRVINVVADYSKYTETSFDFLQTLKLQEGIEVTSAFGDGSFSSGVVQYAFTYYNKFMQETSIFKVSQLLYAANEGRGASPEDTVSISFNIRLTGLDNNFEYVRAYSIFRSTLNGDVVVKRLGDFNINDIVTIKDDGVTGELVDESILLYIGGEYLIPQTLQSKDGTLFLGNLTLEPPINYQEIVDNYRENKNQYDFIMTNQTLGYSVPKDTFYDYTPSINSENSARFKFDEVYRCGIQFQNKFGKWSEPVFLQDRVLNTTFPEAGNGIIYTQTEIKFGTELVKELVDLGIKKARTCVIYPELHERKVICQGILSPTLYNVDMRNSDRVHSVASWFFRPIKREFSSSLSSVYTGADIEYRHNKPLFTGDNRGAEIQNMITSSEIKEANDIESSEDLLKYNNYFFVDENVLTLNSPELDFSTDFHNYDLTNTQLRIVGIAELGANSGDIEIETETAPYHSLALGFMHRTLKYTTSTSDKKTGGLVSGLFYKDRSLKSSLLPAVLSQWMVYPWNKTGSITDDTQDLAAGNDSDNSGIKEHTQAALLKSKTISNLKFFDTTKKVTPWYCNITTPQFCQGTEVSYQKFKLGYINSEKIYQGCVDTLLKSTNGYSLYKVDNTAGETIADDFTEDPINPIIEICKDPVRMMYKQSPHLVFSLKGQEKTIVTLPRISGSAGNSNENYTAPFWFNLSANSKFLTDKKITFITDDILTSGEFVDPKNFKETNCEYGINEGDLAIAKYQRVSNQTEVPYVLYEAVFVVSKGNLVWKLAYDLNLSGKIVKIPNGALAKGIPFPGTDPGEYENAYLGQGVYVYTGADVYLTISGNLSDIDPRIFMVNKDNCVAVEDEIDVKLKLQTSTIQGIYRKPYVFIAEIYRSQDGNEDNLFGGSLQNSLSKKWHIASNEVSLVEGQDLRVPFSYGDTWFQRYDCLKTYPMSPDAENSVIEIGSFMLETRINIDGRYDRNRGLISNLYVSPQNFNLINDVYSQKNNYFVYRRLDDSFYKNNKFLNQVVWTKEKLPNSFSDPWTQVTLASTMNIGENPITALKLFNDKLFYFQKDAFGYINFNDRVQIPVTDGVPIEISNGYKVDGYRQLGKVGCLNKWSIVSSPEHMYFMDDLTDSIYEFSGEKTTSLSDGGMSQWLRDNHSDITWVPDYTGTTKNGFRAFFDSKYQDVYFVPGDDNSKRKALCFSEKLGKFTSFMDYNGTPAMFNWDNKFYSLYPAYYSYEVNLWENFAGEYNKIYGKPKDFSFTFISNDEPQYCKVFDYVEYKADVTNMETNSHEPKMTFDYIYAENEYQKTKDTKIDAKKKFRVWRALVPRAIDPDSNLETRQRIRNPWTKVKLGWRPDPEATHNNYKFQLYDISMMYSV